MKGTLNIVIIITLVIMAFHSSAQVTVAWTGSNGNIRSDNAGGGVSFGRFEGSSSNVFLQGGLQNTVGAVAGLTEIGGQQPFMVYPNPTNSHIFVDIPVEVKVQIFNIQGTLIQTSTSGEIDISHLSSGTYIVTAPGYAASRIIKL